MIYRYLLRPLLYLLPAELAHNVAFAGLRAAARVPLLLSLLRGLFAPRQDDLAVEAMGVRFPTPVGLAAGFDKNASAYRGLSALGFGFVEVGTVTAEGQAGNPKPRLFRLVKDAALLNRLGFNNQGSAAAARRLERKGNCVVGVNIGKTKKVTEEDAVSDYALSARRLGPYADYMVVNVSSPNTPGLRALQAVDKLRPILAAVQRELDALPKPPPLLVKIAPDLSDEDVIAVADLALDMGLAGIVATNTTIRRDGLSTPAKRVAALGAGGISGSPVQARSFEVLKLLRARVGTRLTLVSVGGICDPEDAWQRLRAGASLLQLYTAFVYQGPAVAGRLARTLAARAEREGYASLAAVVGSASEAV